MDADFCLSGDFGFIKISLTGKTYFWPLLTELQYYFDVRHLKSGTSSAGNELIKISTSILYIKYIKDNFVLSTVILNSISRCSCWHILILLPFPYNYRQNGPHH